MFRISALMCANSQTPSVQFFVHTEIRRAPCALHVGSWFASPSLHYAFLFYLLEGKEVGMSAVRGWQNTFLFCCFFFFTFNTVPSYIPLSLHPTSGRWLHRQAKAAPGRPALLWLAAALPTVPLISRRRRADLQTVRRSALLSVFPDSPSSAPNFLPLLTPYPTWLFCPPPRFPPPLTLPVPPSVPDLSEGRPN